MKSEKCTPDPHAKQENDSTATKDNAGVRRALVRSVDDIEMRRQSEVNHFQQKKQYSDYTVQQICIHINWISTIL